MYQYEEEKTQPSLLNLGVIALVFIILAVYSMISLSTGDLLWFWPYFSEEPAQVVVHCYGDSIVLEEDSPGFSDLVAAVNNIMSGRKRWDPLSLSDETYEDYLNHATMLTVEVVYNSTVRVHSMYKYFSNIERLIIPLDARHSQMNAVFGRTNDQPAGGSLHLTSNAPLLEEVNAQGICALAGLD